MTVQDICKSFDIKGKYVKCKELSTGNINSTYKVEYEYEGEQRYYIIQHINTNVFSEPVKLMDNIVRVTEHVHDRIKNNGMSTRKFVLHVYKAKGNGQPFFIDENGEYWRCYRYIPDSVTFDYSDDYVIINRVGEAFGRFEKFLDGFDANSLFVTIPDFHNTPARFYAFRNAVESDLFGRVATVEDEIKRLFALEAQACILQKKLDSGDIPLRVIHNDTKCNNVSFDMHTGEALAVLDLDTVMPGAIAYDFGDGIRFIANTLEEDDPDYGNVRLDVKKFDAFANGFLSQVKSILTESEKETIYLGVLAMTTELAVRFLTDYLNGDTYFKTRYPGHNLDRARNQLALAEDILKKTDLIKQITDKYIKE